MAQLEPLNLRLTGSADGLTAALGKAESRVGAFGGVLGSIGSRFSGLVSAFNPATAAISAGLAAVTAGATAAAIAVAKIGEQFKPIDDLNDAAAKLGITFSELKGIRLAIGEATGLQGEVVDQAIAKFQLNLAEAASKQSGTVFDRLKTLGLDARELIAEGPIGAIEAIASKVQDLKSPTDQLRVAFELFGKSGAGLVNALREGPEALRETVQWAERSLGLTDEQVARVAQMNDKWDRINLRVEAFWQVLAAEAAPVVESIIDGLAIWADSFGGIQTIVRNMIDSLAIIAGTIHDIHEASMGEDFNFNTADKYLAKLKEIREAAAAPKAAAPSESELALMDQENEALDKQAKEWEKKAERFREQLRTPAEKMRDGLMELQGAVDRGGLDWETYARGVKSVTDEFVKAKEASSTSPTALLSAVTERADQIRVIAQREQAKRDTKLQEQLLAEAKEQVKQLTQLVAVVKEQGNEGPPINID